MNNERSHRRDAVPEQSQPPGFGVTILGAILSLQIIGWQLLTLAHNLTLKRFAFSDQGDNLTVTYLLQHGFHPTIDFGWTYGLLPLLFGRIWFWFTGATPMSYQLAMLALGLVGAWGLARAAVALQLGLAGELLLMVTIGHSIMTSYFYFAHALEAALLCHALAFQARGKRGEALVLVTLSLFTKPSMAYFYGLLLLILISRQMKRVAPFSVGWILPLVPALTTCATLVIVLGATFGPAPLMHTILPLAGAKEYRLEHYGLFSSGMEFLHPRGASLGYYFATITFLWTISSLFLFLTSLATLLRVLTIKGRGCIDRRRDEIVLTCSLLHLSFVFFFLGPFSSWAYYSYFLFFGVAAAGRNDRSWRNLKYVLCLLAVIAYKAPVTYAVRAWRHTAPDPHTAGLRASVAETREWSKILQMARTRKSVLVHRTGAADLLFPEFEEPVGTYFFPGTIPSIEIRREKARIRSASIVVIPREPSLGIIAGREIEEALDKFRLMWRGEGFDVYERDGPDTSRKGSVSIPTKKGDR